MFIFTLLSAQTGYLHLVKTPCKCCSSCCNSLGLEHMVLVLWCRVPITWYFEEIAWWLTHCIYKSVCVGFLKTVVARLPSSQGVINMSRKGMDPSGLGSSPVNWMWWYIELTWSKKTVFELLWWWQMYHLQIFSTSKGAVLMYLWLSSQSPPYINLPLWDCFCNFSNVNTYKCEWILLILFNNI